MFGEIFFYENRYLIKLSTYQHNQYKQYQQEHKHNKKNKEQKIPIKIKPIFDSEIFNREEQFIGNSPKRLSLTITRCSLSTNSKQT